MNRSVWQPSIRGLPKIIFITKNIRRLKIIKLNGSIELAPIVGLSEVICDIVETGTTLRENGLNGVRGSLSAFCTRGRKPGKYENGK